MMERPFIIGGILIVLGYLKGWITKASRYEYPGFRQSLHAWQFERLKIGKRLETIPGSSNQSDNSFNIEKEEKRPYENYSS